MADAKKTGKKSETKAAKSPAKSASAAASAPASTAKKGAAKKVEKPAAAGMPLINTSNAAEAAAKMIGNKLSSMGGDSSAGKHESASFRQLKESLNKPAGQGAASFIQSTAPTKKSSQPFGGPNQVRHNQTFGADVNRAGVPRRTGGG